MILDDSFRIIVMNRLMEAMTGYSTDRVTGIHGELVVRSNTGNNKGQLYNKVMQTGEAISVTGDIINSSRRKIAVQYTISILDRHDQGDHKHCGLLVMVEDLSAREVEHKSGTRNFTTIELIGYSPKMQKVFDMIPLLAQTDASVMITGETGTGKDKIAEIIHQKSSRARFPFIKINCGALPAGLLESELFGHVKGAFTGASRNKPGMFSLADKGTCRCLYRSNCFRCSMTGSLFRWAASKKSPLMCGSLPQPTVRSGRRFVEIPFAKIFFIV
jgi:transcriptional regulator with PAS, ATPase and Fis domain